MPRALLRLPRDRAERSSGASSTAALLPLLLRCRAWQGLAKARTGSLQEGFTTGIPGAAPRPLPGTACPVPTPSTLLRAQTAHQTHSEGQTRGSAPRPATQLCSAPLSAGTDGTKPAPVPPTRCHTPFLPTEAQTSQQHRAPLQHTELPGTQRSLKKILEGWAKHPHEVVLRQAKPLFYYRALRLCTKLVEQELHWFPLGAQTAAVQTPESLQEIFLYPTD